MKTPNATRMILAASVSAIALSGQAPALAQEKTAAEPAAASETAEDAKDLKLGSIVVTAQRRESPRKRFRWPSRPSAKTR